MLKAFAGKVVHTFSSLLPLHLIPLLPTLRPPHLPPHPAILWHPNTLAQLDSIPYQCPLPNFNPICNLDTLSYYTLIQQAVGAYAAIVEYVRLRDGSGASDGGAGTQNGLGNEDRVGESRVGAYEGGTFEGC